MAKTTAKLDAKKVSWPKYFARRVDQDACFRLLCCLALSRLVFPYLDLHWPTDEEKKEMEKDSATGNSNTSEESDGNKKKDKYQIPDGKFPRHWITELYEIIQDEDFPTDDTEGIALRQLFYSIATDTHSVKKQINSPYVYRAWWIIFNRAMWRILCADGPRIWNGAYIFNHCMDKSEALTLKDCVINWTPADPDPDPITGKVDESKQFHLPAASNPGPVTFYEIDFTRFFAPSEAGTGWENRHVYNAGVFSIRNALADAFKAIGLPVALTPSDFETAQTHKAPTLEEKRKKSSFRRFLAGNLGYWHSVKYPMYGDKRKGGVEAECLVAAALRDDRYCQGWIDPFFFGDLRMFNPWSDPLHRLNPDVYGKQDFPFQGYLALAACLQWLEEENDGYVCPWNFPSGVFKHTVTGHRITASGQKDGGSSFGDNNTVDVSIELTLGDKEDWTPTVKVSGIYSESSSTCGFAAFVNAATAAPLLSWQTNTTEDDDGNSVVRFSNLGGNSADFLRAIFSGDAATASGAANSVAALPVSYTVHAGWAADFYSVIPELDEDSDDNDFAADLDISSATAELRSKCQLFLWESRRDTSASSGIAKSKEKEDADNYDNKLGRVTGIVSDKFSEAYRDHLKNLASLAAEAGLCQDLTAGEVPGEARLRLSAPVPDEATVSFTGGTFLATCPELGINTPVEIPHFSISSTSGASTYNSQFSDSCTYSPAVHIEAELLDAEKSAGKSCRISIEDAWLNVAYKQNRFKI